MQPDVSSFLDRFTRFGAEPSTRSYLSLFHPDATLFDSGMLRPITVAEIPEHIEGILKLVPDFRMVPERWRERDGSVFVEARNSATLGRRRMEWSSVYCVDLTGDLVIRGRRYYDRRALFALLDPSLPELPVNGPAVLPRLLPGLSQELQQWAGDDELLFLEWKVSARIGGERIAFGLAERLELDAGHVRGVRAYFDTLELAARLAASEDVE